MAKTKTPIKDSKNDGKLKSSFSENVTWFVGLFVFTFLLFAYTLGHGFVLDDPLSLALNTNVTAGFAGIGDIITGGYRANNFGGQLYRPVSLIQFAIEWSISPNNPMIHHFFNVFWYGLSVGMIFLLVKKWALSTGLIFPVLAAILFAVHPIHTEVVANIKSRDEIMSLFFVLTSLFTWHEYMAKNKSNLLVMSVILYFAALLSKETAITMFPIYGLVAWIVYGREVRSVLTKGMIFLLPVLSIFVIRHLLFGGQESTPIDIMDNPIVAADSFLQRMATSMVLLLKYLQLMFYPYPLSSDYSYTVIPLSDLADWKAWVGLMVHLGMFVYAVLGLRERRFISLCILGYFMAISLFSQIPMVIGTMFGERLAYLASFWWILGAIYLVKAWIPSEKWLEHKAFLSVSAIIILVFSFLTIQRTADWKSNLTLFTADAATYPQSVRLNNGAAEETLRTADSTDDESTKNAIYEKTEAYCNQIMTIKPVATAYLTLGNIRMKQKRYEDAITYYDQVNDLQNIVDINKALALREMGRQAGEKEQNIQKSQDLLTRSLKLNDKDAESWFLMGVSYGVSGNHLLAAEHFEKAYSHNPSPEYAKNVVMAYRNVGNQAKIDQYSPLMGGK